MRALAQAVRFLTVLPWPGAHREPEADDMARVLVRFPFVGLLIGAILIALDWALASAFPVSVRSALLVIALVVLTRGLPLDGLSDFADALGLETMRRRVPRLHGRLAHHRCSAAQVRLFE